MTARSSMSSFANFGPAILGLAMQASTLIGCATPVPISSEPEPSVSPPSDANGDTPAKHGTHGMVMFGRTALWASHLPMYEAPHDAQVVLAVELVDPTIADAYRRELGEAPLVTFVPEPFDLRVLEPGGTGMPTLRGTIVRGHFERGGEVWREDVETRTRIVWYRAIDGGAQDAAAAVAFGNGNETYLMNLVGARPGTDRIVAVEGPAPTAAEGVVVSDEVLAGHGWRNPRVVYEERADLQ